MIDPTHVDVLFPLAGKSIPLDHGYLLFSALSRVLPAIHERKGWGIHPVMGNRTGPGVLELIPQSSLKLRLPAAEIGAALPLAGKTLDLVGQPLRVGIPRVFPLDPKPTLKSRFVTIKHHADSEEDFAAAVRQQLAALPKLGQPSGSVEVTVAKRRVMRVGEQTIVGFPVVLSGLEADASLRVQQFGLGGRRHMGAGLFVPMGRAKA